MPTTPAFPPDLLRRHVMVVEDDFLQADGLCAELEEHGATIVGPFADVEDALASIEATPELAAAILDLDLHGMSSYPVADALQRRGVELELTRFGGHPFT